ncbi:hypothetical protein PINS_up001991 [Pythium insidiosum]|nr:hypothetical protein PINS_up001991 [Pythium insidiosum]
MLRAPSLRVAISYSVRVISFGEIGVVMEVERTRSVRAECMSELCILSREGFEKILAEFPEFAMAMRRLIIKRVNEMWSGSGHESIEKMTKLADHQMKKKIVAYKNVNKIRGAAQVLQSLGKKKFSSTPLHGVEGAVGIPTLDPINEQVDEESKKSGSSPRKPAESDATHPEAASSTTHDPTAPAPKRYDLQQGSFPITSPPSSRRSGLASTSSINEYPAS